MTRPLSSDNKDPSGSLETVVAAIAQVMGPGTPPHRVRPTDRLGADLAMSSLAVVRLAGILQKRLGRGPLPLHTLFVKPDGTVLHDIRVSDLAEFVSLHTGGTP